MDINLASIYAQHCPLHIKDIEDKTMVKVYRAHCFGVYDALRSVAARLEDEEAVHLLEQLHGAILGENV